MNGNIKENLDRYINLNAPEFAIALSSKWGGGKTHFLKKYIQEQTKKNKNVRFVKVSLLGVNDTSQMHRQVITNLIRHNRKSLTTRITEVVLSFFGKKYNISIEDIPIDFVVNSIKKEVVFVFDDLGSNQSIEPTMLEYIGAFVQRYNYKVILLIDTDKLSADESRMLEDFKERVVGNDLDLKLELDNTLDDFINSLESKNTKDILKNNFMTIRHIYKEYGTHNLRYIKKNILDFEFLVEHIRDKYLDSKDFTTDLVKRFFMYVAMQPMRDMDEGHSFLDKSGAPRHGMDYLFDENLWSDILLNAKIDTNRLNANIASSKYFIGKNSSSWIRLWHFRQLQDDEFRVILNDVDKKFVSGEYKSPELMLLVSSMLLYFSKHGLYETPSKEIVQSAKKNIEQMAQNDTWNKHVYWYEPKQHKDGLNYYAEDNPDFIEIYNYMQLISQESFDKILEQKAIELIDDIRAGNMQLVASKLQDFHATPIMCHANLEEFIDCLVKLPNDKLEAFGLILADKYLPSNTKLYDELNFWILLDEKILKSIDQAKQPVKYKIFSDMKKNIFGQIVKNMQKE